MSKICSHRAVGVSSDNRTVHQHCGKFRNRGRPRENASNRNPKLAENIFQAKGIGAATNSGSTEGKFDDIFLLTFHIVCFTE